MSSVTNFTQTDCSWVAYGLCSKKVADMVKYSQEHFIKSIGMLNETVIDSMLIQGEPQMSRNSDPTWIPSLQGHNLQDQYNPKMHELEKDFRG